MNEMMGEKRVYEPADRGGSSGAGSSYTENVPIRWPRWTGYAVTVVLEIGVTLVLYFLLPFFPLANFPIPYVLVMMAVAYLFGEGPAVLAFFLGLFAFTYYFVPPHHTLWPLATTPEGWARLTAFLIGTAIVGFATVMIRRGRNRVERLAEDLRESGQRTNNILESISDGFVAVDQQWRYTYVNREAELLLGRTRNELVGRNIWEMLPEVVGTEFHDACQRAMSERVAATVEYYIPQLGGWFDARISPSIDGLSIYFRNITERKQSEDTLKRYQFLMEQVRDPFLLMRRDGRLIEANSAAVAAYGYTREELLSLSIHDLRDPETLAEVGPQMAEADSAGILFETRHRRKDGSIFPVEVSSRGTAIGDERVLLSVIRDISERKHAEQELAQTRAEAERRAAEMESFIASMADGVTLLDAEGKVVIVNEAGRDILDIPPGGSLEWQNYERYTLDGEPIPVEQTASYRALHGETVRDERYRTITPWGKEVVLSISSSPVRDVQGRIVGATSVFRDQGERVDFERRRQELYEREHRIAETLQQALVPPQVAYEVEGCRIAVKYQPALEEAAVGGDFYDVFELGDGKVGILIGDVAGKGLLAAIRVAAARYAIRSYAYLDPDPGKVMTLANDTLSRDPTDGFGMLTAFFAVVDTREGTMTYANGGHEPPVIRGAEGDIEELSLAGRALGVFGGFTYPEASSRLRPGDVVVITTDGVTEARRGRFAFFGLEGVVKYLLENRQVPLDEIPSGLLEAATAFAGGSLQDDAAIVAFELEP